MESRAVEREQLQNASEQKQQQQQKRKRMEYWNFTKGKTPTYFGAPSPMLVVRHVQEYGKPEFGITEEPFRWRATRVEDPSQRQYRMTVMALVGSLDQSTQHLRVSCVSSCGLLACLIAEWILLHPTFSAPPSTSLDAIFSTAAALTMARGGQALGETTLKTTIDEYQLRIKEGQELVIAEVPGKGIETNVVPMGDKIMIGGGFWEVFDEYVRKNPRKVYVVNISNQHFTVLHVDKDLNFWYVDTMGSMLHLALDRAYVLAFQRGTVFEDLTATNRRFMAPSSATACKCFFMYILFSNLRKPGQAGERFVFTEMELAP